MANIENVRSVMKLVGLKHAQNICYELFSFRRPEAKNQALSNCFQHLLN